MNGELWTRDEYILTLDLYLNYPEIVVDTGDPDIQKVATLINRSPAAVVQRLGNYRFLDPDASKGLSHISQGCRQIWEEYHGIKSELASEAARIREILSGASTPAENIGDSGEASPRIETGESMGNRRMRRGQRDFRGEMLIRFDNQCLLCDVAEPGLLIAAHILAWAENEEERGDPANGLLLCYTHHEAFDLGMFTLSESFDCVVSPHFNPDGDYLRRTIVNRDGHRLQFPSDPPSPEYLARRNEKLYWWPVDSDG